MRAFLLLVSTFLTSSVWSLDRNWWKYATIYEIYGRSFQDSNGDGTGDFKGIISRLDYLADIGIDTIYMTPFYPSSMADGGYDITNFTAVDPIYGTMEDFQELMKEIKNRGMKFVMDLVINHSSDEHEWFIKSINKEEPYTDYYVWKDPKSYDRNGHPVPPNNWISIFNGGTMGSGWTWNEKRRQFYFHQFGVKQPDFDLRNELLKKELKDMMKFWLDKGVTAFRVDAPAYFMEDSLLRDQTTRSQLSKVIPGTEEARFRTFNHPDTFKFLNELNLYLQQYDRKSKKEYKSVMMAEVYAYIDIIMQYYGTKNYPATHFPFNFQLTLLNKYLDADGMRDYLNMWIERLPEHAASNWALGNHDRGRMYYYFNKEYNYILLALVTMLPGASTIYYGEEITQEQLDQTPERVKNLWIERDLFRLPMQWDDTFNAGFTSAEKPWLPVHPGYWRLNVQAQKAHPNSTLNYFKGLVGLRKMETMKYGDLKFYTVSKWVLAFTRTYKQDKYTIVLNLGTESHYVDLHSSVEDLPSTLRVLVASPNSGYIKGDTLNCIPIHPYITLLRPYSCIVLH